MTILVQRSYRVAPGRHEQFERLSAERTWPALHARGVPMVAFGGWTFGGTTDELTAHFAYADFAHVDAAHASLDIAVEPDGELAGTSSARVVELTNGTGGIAASAAEGEAAPPLPVTFGRGSIVSERTYVVAAGAQGEFLRLSQELLWPWLEEHGARMVGFGHDPFGPSDQLVTLFAFRSLAEWYRLSRPEPELSPPAEMVEGWQQRTALIERHWGRLLTVATDYGRPA